MNSIIAFILGSFFGVAVSFVALVIVWASEDQNHDHE